jgi:hypothetical protein
MARRAGHKPSNFYIDAEQFIRRSKLGATFGDSSFPDHVAEFAPASMMMVRSKWVRTSIEYVKATKFMGQGQ